MKYYELIEHYKKIINNENLEIEAIYYIIEELCHITRSELLLNKNEEINDTIKNKIINIIDNYINNHIPVQYLIGYSYFYGYRFIVNNNVLIPRFDTEIVVDKILEEAKKNNIKTIVDIGTGSGCIAIVLKKELPNTNIYAIDISHEAIEVAKENQKLMNVDITFIENDLLNNINMKFDMIVSNPPYIDINDSISDVVKDHEPSIALFSPNHGLYHYEKILEQSKNCLNKKGIIILEIPSTRTNELIEIVKKYYQNCEVYQDLNHLNRVMVIRT